jgi:hypothetical protein
MKKLIGSAVALVAILVCVYLVLGMLRLVPLVGYFVFGETLLRFMTQVCVGSFLLAAICFWEI